MHVKTTTKAIFLVGLILVVGMFIQIQDGLAYQRLTTTISNNPPINLIQPLEITAKSLPPRWWCAVEQLI